MKAEIIEQAKDFEYALYATCMGQYIFHHKKSIKLDIIAKSGLHLISLFPAIK